MGSFLEKSISLFEIIISLNFVILSKNNFSLNLTLNN